MNLDSLSAQDVAEAIGRRIKALRLERNITQKKLAQATLLSLNTIKALESGNAKLSTIVVVLRELDALDAIASFIAKPSPEASSHPGTRVGQRQRATGGRGNRRKDG